MPGLLDTHEDIIESLLEELEHQKELKTIKSLALCCKALLPLCRRRIFSSIELSMFKSHKSAFNEETAIFIESNSDVSSFVKQLVLSWHVSITIPGHILRIVRSFRHICTFILFGAHGDWERITEETKDAVLHVLSLPTLSNLIISGIKNFPASAFTTCINIATLDLDYTTISDSNSTRNHEHKRIPSLRSFTTSLFNIVQNTDILIGDSSSSETTSFIDFTNLQHLIIHKEDKTEYRMAATKVMTTAHRSLKSFTLHCGVGETQGGVAASIRDSEVLNLECFLTSFYMYDDKESSFFTILCDELLQMSLDNHSEGLVDIQITVKVSEVSKCDRLQEWSRLDSILSGDGFKRLARVSVAVMIDNRVPYGSPMEIRDTKRRMEMISFSNLKSRSGRRLFTYKVLVVGDKSIFD